MTKREEFLNRLNAIAGVTISADALSRRPPIPLASPYSADSDFVFTTATGSPLNWLNVERRGLDQAAERAGLNSGETPKLRFHDLRHTFASLLIAQGANVVFVSRQIGHASVATTLNVYAHLFDGAEYAESTSAKLEASFGNVLETEGRNRPQSEATAASGEVVSLQALSDYAQLAATLASVFTRGRSLVQSQSRPLDS